MHAYIAWLTVYIYIYAYSISGVLNYVAIHTLHLNRVLVLLKYELHTLHLNRVLVLI